MKDRLMQVFNVMVFLSFTITVYSIAFILHPLVWLLTGKSLLKKVTTVYNNVFDRYDPKGEPKPKKTFKDRVQEKLKEGRIT